MNCMHVLPTPWLGRQGYYVYVHVYQWLYLYSLGMFILMSSTDDTKYIPCKEKYVVQRERRGRRRRRGRRERERER